MDDEDECSVIPPEPFRMFLVGILGTAIASISLVFNFFLFVILTVNPSHRRTHLIYLILLAFIDVFLSGEKRIRVFGSCDIDYSQL